MQLAVVVSKLNKAWQRVTKYSLKHMQRDINREKKLANNLKGIEHDGILIVKVEISSLVREEV